MAVATDLFRGFTLAGQPGLGAIETPEGLILGFAAGAWPDRLRAGLAENADIRAVGRSLLVRLSDPVDLPVDKADTARFRGKSVIVAIRNGETPHAAMDWLDWHCETHGAEASLIVDRDPQGQPGFASALENLGPSLPVTVVSADQPLGLAGAPDARHPSLAPGAPAREMPPVDPWHAPMGQLVLYELLRHRFLAEARSVVFLDVGDLLLPDPGNTVFERTRDAGGQVVMLSGTETYPWRLRQNRPAPHSDHIARRRGERRWLSSWAAAPDLLPADALWKPVRAVGADTLEAAPLSFRRAMGVVFPGVPVNKLVRKSELVEDPELVRLMSDRGASPIRLPKARTLPPRPESGRVTVVTAMKNEGPFVLDWIAHNRAIGIETHLVYTNDCADGTDRLLDLLGEAGVTRRDNPYRALGKVPQYAAFKAAEAEDAVTAADWLLTLDVDEYINIQTGQGHIPDLLEAVPEAHAISMPWRLFGNNDIHAFDDRPVPEMFTRAAPEYAPRPLQAWAFKTLYRNAGLFRRLGVHRPKGVEKAARERMRWVDGNGHEIPPATWRACWRVSKSNWGYDLVSLNHYAVRSAESFLVKRDRGRVNHTTRDQGEAYWFRMNHNAEEDHSIRRLDGARAAEKARLLALPGVAEAHAASVDWHRGKIAALKRDPDHAQLFAAITSPRMENLSRLSTYFGSNVHYAGPHVIPDEVANRPPGETFFFTVDRDAIR